MFVQRHFHTSNVTSIRGNYYEGDFSLVVISENGGFSSDISLGHRKMTEIFFHFQFTFLIFLTGFLKAIFLNFFEMLFEPSETSSGEQFFGIRIPVLSVTSSEVPPTFVAIIGIPKLIASIMDTGRPSDELVLIKTSTGTLH